MAESWPAIVDRSPPVTRLSVAPVPLLKLTLPPEPIENVCQSTMARAELWSTVTVDAPFVRVAVPATTCPPVGKMMPSARAGVEIGSPISAVAMAAADVRPRKVVAPVRMISLIAPLNFFRKTTSTLSKYDVRTVLDAPSPDLPMRRDSTPPPHRPKSDCWKNDAVDHPSDSES